MLEAGDKGLGVGGGDVTLPNTVIIAALSCFLVPKTGDEGLEAGKDAIAARGLSITFLLAFLIAFAIRGDSRRDCGEGKVERGDEDIAEDRGETGVAACTTAGAISCIAGDSCLGFSMILAGLLSRVAFKGKNYYKIIG